jgi:ABC-type transport system substrate-binding protein
MDVKARKDIVWKMQKMIFDARPYIVLFYSEDSIAYRKDRWSFDPETGNWRIKSAITHKMVKPL